MPFFQTENIKTTDFDAMRLKLASPEIIRNWSYGEVTKPETINYRTQKPEKSGLFAEEIFGPSKDWECYCGKYKKIRFKGIVCDKCGVEVTHSLVRRERMGHIELAAPVSHIWFLRGVPSKIGTTLDMSMQALEKVVYFASFIITDVNEELRQNTIELLRAEYKGKQKAIESEYLREVERANSRASEQNLGKKEAEAALEKVHQDKELKVQELDHEYAQAERDLKDIRPLRVMSENEYHELSLKFGHVFEAKIGAEAVNELLGKMDVAATAQALEEELKTASDAKRDRVIRRLKLLKSFVMQGLDPSWMILKVVPVIPPDLRPMVPLDGGRFATSDLNDLYRRVINRNNRLKRLIELNAPEVITRNEKRMLQEAVDSLIDNSARHSKTVIAATGKKRQLKSLADSLKGKQGRFRQNLLGKRIDYSGRSVIVIGPTLHMHQCGLPKIMALELFRPFIISELIKREYVHNIRSANRYIEADHSEVWDILEKIANEAVVLLNRAPTLHRLGIQGFQPVLIEGKAIQIHPMVCSAFNADFDGDQMAVHVPLTEEARQEARNLMLSTNNLLKPATGQPVARPDKDIAWGAFYMTTMIEPKDGKIKTFGDIKGAVYAYQAGKIDVRERMKTRIPSLGSAITETNVGRIILNDLFPKEVGFRNEAIGTKQLADITRITLEVRGFERTARFLDEVKEMGFKFATTSGFSYGMGDLPDVDVKKHELVEEGERKVREIETQYEEGLLTKSERYNQIIKIWSDVKDRVQRACKESLDPLGTVYSMIESGARGSIGQLTNVSGMKGLVGNPSGNIIELPVKSSLREGLDVLEYFISSHGARKGLTDTALKTANAGYLTRRLVDVAQDVVIIEADCGDTDGVVLTATECEYIGEPLLTRLLGRVLISDLKEVGGKKAILPKGTLITQQHIRDLEKRNIAEAHVRSVLLCKCKRGICQQCYGYDLSYNEMVKLGTAIGTIAAQSIGEPGTQLTMRTFHMGGVAGGDITMGLPRVEELFEARTPKRKAVISEVAGKVKIINGERRIIELSNGERVFDTNSGGKVVSVEHIAMQDDIFVRDTGDKSAVKDGVSVKVGQVLINKVDGNEVKAEHAGVVTIQGKNVKVAWEGPTIMEYQIPLGYQVLVKDGDEVQLGDALTEGHLDLSQLFKYKGREEVMRYMLKETLFIYASQGQKLNAKHVEVIIRQMFSRVYVKDAGDTDLLPGEVVDRARLRMEGENAEGEGKKGATADDLFMGITKISLSTESFLSAASFQETAKVLINAAITGKVDKLEGLKENVIIGRLIPAGTGFGVHLNSEGEAFDDEDETERSIS
ncbi:MAG: DNA-directed RNA polymerase subunit beta' [Patescibacteria group bacterium]